MGRMKSKSIHPQAEHHSEEMVGWKKKGEKGNGSNTPLDDLIEPEESEEHPVTCPANEKKKYI